MGAIDDGTVTLKALAPPNDDSSNPPMVIIIIDDDDVVVIDEVHHVGTVRVVDAIPMISIMINSAARMPKSSTADDVQFTVVTRVINERSDDDDDDNTIANARDPSAVGT
jgi:hypothetical protein